VLRFRAHRRAAPPGGKSADFTISFVGFSKEIEEVSSARLGPCARARSTSVKGRETARSVRADGSLVRDQGMRVFADPDPASDENQPKPIKTDQLRIDIRITGAEPR
jgi:hypothetical protein